MLKIIFEFHGGPFDGETLHGALGESSDAERYFLFTNHGTVGNRFKVASEYAVEMLASEELKDQTDHHFQPHFYVVADRLEDSDEVIVRAEYLETEADLQPLVKQYLEPASAQDETMEDKIHRYLEQLAKSLAASNSHCWPADQRGNLAMHFAHVLLNENFSVFTCPPGTVPEMVSISANQDWFLVSRFRHWEATPPRELIGDMQQLLGGWLSPEFAIPACRSYVSRFAEHCEAGYALIAGLYWVPAGADASAPVDEDPEMQRALSDIGATQVGPLRVQALAEVGTCHLLGMSFPLPRSSGASF